MTTDGYIETLLFFKGQPQKKTAIMKLLDIDEQTFIDAVAALRQRLASGALRLVETDSEIQLATAPEYADFIETLRKDEIKGDIGKAGAETLAIILYRGPVTRAEIDHIRGVNSSFILRNLQIRGLIERSPAKQGSGYQFAATPQLLTYLGVQYKQELPDFAHILNRLDTFMQQPEEVT